MSAQPWPTQDNLDTLNDVIRRVARTGRLPAQDAEDFGQSVHLKLLERNYDVFARFEGRSSLRTYLTVVVKRLMLDWRNASQGKWRCSAIAARLGATAVTLERLIYRDAHRTSEAVQALRTRGCMESTADLYELCRQIPPREKRQVISDEILSRSPTDAFEDPLDAEQQRRRRDRAVAALARVIRDLPSGDRRLLRVRYQRTQSLREFARSLGTDPKQVYRRLDQVLRSLRLSLEAAGLMEEPN